MLFQIFTWNPTHFSWWPVAQGHRHKILWKSFLRVYSFKVKILYIWTFDRYCFRFLLWASTMVLIDHEGQGHILRTVFMMDKHQFRQAMLSGDSSCFIDVSFCCTCFSKVWYRHPFFRLSVSPSIRQSFCPQFMLTLAFKSIQMTYSLKPLHPWILNFIFSMIRRQGFRIY